MVPPHDTSDKHDKTSSRAVVPSGAIRSRRVYTRSKKGKGRSESTIDQVASASNLASASQDKDHAYSRPRHGDIKRNKSFHGPQSHVSHQSKTAQAHSPQPDPAKVSKTPAPPPQNPPRLKVGPSQQPQSETAPTIPPAIHSVEPHCPPPNIHPKATTESRSPDLRSPLPPSDSPKPPQNHPHPHSISFSPRLIVDISPAKTDHSDGPESTQSASACVDGSTTDASRLTTNTSPSNGRDPFDLDQIKKNVATINMARGSDRPRPLICQDITNSNADTLRISRLPQGVTYDRLMRMVEPFGEVDELVWTASDPYVCEVTYKDPSAAQEAYHFLHGAMVGNNSELPLKAELKSRDPGAQLFVGDLTPDVTEEMLEEKFSKLVGGPVSALLKRDPDSFSPIGYGFLSFQNEASANYALVAGHRAKVGNACVRVGRAERNTYLYVSDLHSDVTASELKDVFGQFGSLVDEDTVIIRRSYAFIRYKNRGSAEKAKRTLDKTDLKGRISVRYAEAEPLKACVAVQFHSSVPRPPNSLRDLLSTTFSKFGNCSIEIPRLQNGMWRKVAFVTYHGDSVAANLAALEAVQSVRSVSTLPVCCQFARELIPRFPSRGMVQERLADADVDRVNGMMVGDRMNGRGFYFRKNHSRRTGPVSEGPGIRHGHPMFEQQRIGQFGHENGPVAGGPDFVPVFVPVTALQHPGGMGGGPQGHEPDFGPYQQHWDARMMMPPSIAAGANIHANAPSNMHGNAPSMHANAAPNMHVNAPPNMHANTPHVPANYNAFPPLQDRMMRW